MLWFTVFVWWFKRFLADTTVPNVLHCSFRLWHVGIIKGLIEWVRAFGAFCTSEGNILGCSLVEGWGKLHKLSEVCCSHTSVRTSCHPGSADWITVIGVRWLREPWNLYMWLHSFFPWKVMWYTQLFKSLGVRFFLFLKENIFYSAKIH